MIGLKRTGIYVLAASMMVCAVACDTNGISIIPSSLNVTSDQVLSLAEDYAGALIDINADKIIALSSSVSEDNQEFLKDFSFESVYGEDSASVYEAYYKTISYDVLEDTVTIDGDKVSVDVRFNYADYFSIAPDSYAAEGWIDAINSSEDIENIDIKFDFEVKNINGVDTLVIKNSNKIINKYFFDEVANVYFYVETFVFYEDAVEISWSKEKYEATDTIRVSLVFDKDERPNGKDVSVKVYDMALEPIFDVKTVYEAGQKLDFAVDAENIGEDYFNEGFYSVIVEAEDGSIYAADKVFVNKFVMPDLDIAVLSGLYESENVTYSMPSKLIHGVYSKAMGEYINYYFDVVIDTPDSDSAFNAGNIMNSKIIKDIPYWCDLALVPKDDSDTQCYVFITHVDKEISSAQDLTAFFAMNGVDVKCDGGMLLGSDDFLYIANSTYMKPVEPVEEEDASDLDDLLDNEDLVLDISDDSESIDNDGSDITESTEESTEETIVTDEELTDSTEASELAAETDESEDSEETSDEEVEEATSEVSEESEENVVEYVEIPVTYLVKYKDGNLFVVELVGGDQEHVDSYITSIRPLKVNAETTIDKTSTEETANEESIEEPAEETIEETTEETAAESASDKED